MVAISPVFFPIAFDALMDSEHLAMTLLTAFGFFFLLGGFVLVLTSIVGTVYRFRKTT